MLESKYDLQNTSGSDCEVIINLYKKIGIDSTVKLLDGEFAFVLIDTNIGLVHFARDYMGVKPLYFSCIQDNNKFVSLEISSLMKSMNLSNSSYHVIPKYLYTYDMNKLTLSEQQYVSLIYQNLHSDKELIYTALTKAVEKRISQSERPIGFLLSGGLDSSLVLSIAMEYYQHLYKKELTKLQLENELLDIENKRTFNELESLAKLSYVKPLVFTFGFSKDAPDVKSANVMVDYLRDKYGHDCMDWHLVIQSIDKGLNSLSSVIYELETYDTTTVRASTPMYLISKYISENTDVKVIISGEGSDELFGGYLYFKYAPNDFAFRSEIITLLNNLFYYDVLRADRTTSAFGLEVRPPFLDRELVRSVLTSGELVCGVNNTKELLRHAVESKNLLPVEILYGKKEAFSDAVGLSWKDSITIHTNNAMSIIDDTGINYSRHVLPITNEMKYYQLVFNRLLQNAYYILPCLWLPNQSWVSTGIEPSARVLSVYDKCDNYDKHDKNNKEKINLSDENYMVMPPEDQVK